MGVFAMPSLGADMEAGTLVEWLVAPGDQVARGDTVAVVETQKGAIEIEVFQDGVVRELTAEIGAELPVGAPMAVILAEGERPAPAPSPAPKASPKPAPKPEPAPVAAPPVAPIPTAAPPETGAARVSPAARKRAGELGLDPGGVTGTGPDGTIILADIDHTAPTQKGKAPPEAKGTQRANIDEMRKAIAAAMARSKRTIPHFSLSHTIDLTAAAAYLDSCNRDRPPAERLLLGALFVRATAHAANAAPTLNGHYADHGFVQAEAVNAGVAIALRGGGLVAPALMDVAELDLDATMEAMRDLVTRARAGRLKGSEMTAGTITISSLGDAGVEAMTGVIFPPQVALVGIGAPVIRPWVARGEVVPRKVVTISVAADHRVADGRQAARFLAAFDAALQQPEDL